MSSPPLSTTSLRSSQDHRAKLLNRLGIYDAPEMLQSQQPMTAAEQRRLRILRGMGVGVTLNPSPPDGSAIRPPLGGVKPTKTHLKSDISSLPITTEKKGTRIVFCEEVEVMPIPSRHEYSNRIKSRIWSNRHELQENAERNAMEFAAEGWNWHGVTEDEGMYICSVSGELVHPIHLQHLVQEEKSPDDESSGGLTRGSPVHNN